jgi:hypothetical protein
LIFFYFVAGIAHTNESPKSHRTTVTHGKTGATARLESHGKTGTHGTTKKSDVHKSRTSKKTDHDKIDPEKDTHTGTVLLYSTKYYLIPLLLLIFQIGIGFQCLVPRTES